jgi:hypothetical protein
LTTQCHNKDEDGKSEATTTDYVVTDNALKQEQQEEMECGENSRFAGPEQPSPAVSDSHTSGSSAQMMDSELSPKKCHSCQVFTRKEFTGLIGNKVK